MASETMNVLTTLSMDGLGGLWTLGAADAKWLMSIWKPVLMLIPFIVWGRIVTGVYDKHAAQFFLPRRNWNLVHLSCGVLALAAWVGLGSVVGGEGGFWAGLGAALLILGGDLFAYMHLANKDERVPESKRIRIGMSKPEGDKGGKKKDVLKGKAAAQIKFTIKSPDGKGKYTEVVGVPALETPEFAARVAAEAVFAEAMAVRATQVEVGPGANGAYQVRQLVDGVYQNGATMPPADAAKVMDFWKLAGKQDVSDRRRKQVSDVSVESPDFKRIVRVTSTGAQGGMRVSLLMEPEKSVQRQPTELGLLEPQMKTLKELAEESQGVVLVATPPDSGRTTLMYGLLRMHDAYTSNVHTVEMEPQGAPEGVRVNKWDPQGGGAVAGGAGAGGPGPEYATLVRSILRRDPDVVAVAELPDPATAQEISKADQQRTRTYLCMKAGDPFTAVQAFVKAVGDTRKAADCLHGVVVGKLVRKLCTNCRVAYPPTADMLRKLGLPEGKVANLFKKGGQVLIKNKPETCPVCKGIGYIGTEGVFEVYPIDKEDRDLIAQSNLQGLKASWRKKNLPSLQQVAIRKAVDGVTSVEEIMRITTEGGSSGAGGGSGVAEAKPDQA